MSTSSPKHHILVIDDDESIRFMMESKLIMEGFKVSLAASGNHAIQVLQSTKDFDLILCDLKMPLKGGIDVIRYLSENQIRTPLILVTGYPEKDKIREAAKMGVSEIVVKPVRHQELIKIIRSKLACNNEKVS